MLKSFLTISLILLNIFSHRAEATEQAILTVKNDDNSKTYLLIIDSNPENREIKTFYKDVYTDGKKSSRETLDYRTLLHSGIVLEKRNQYIILKLKSSNFDEQQGGIITVDTLYNGINGVRKCYDIELTRDKDNWELFNQGQMIKQIFIQTNKLTLVGSVGIKNLIMQ